MKTYVNSRRVLREQLKELEAEKANLKGQAKSQMWRVSVKLQGAINTLLLIDKLNKAKAKL